MWRDLIKKGAALAAGRARKIEAKKELTTWSMRMTMPDGASYSLHPTVRIESEPAKLSPLKVPPVRETELFPHWIPVACVLKWKSMSG